MNTGTNTTNLFEDEMLELGYTKLDRHTGYYRQHTVYHKRVDNTLYGVSIRDDEFIEEYHVDSSGKYIDATYCCVKDYFLGEPYRFNFND